MKINFLFFYDGIKIRIKEKKRNCSFFSFLFSFFF